MVELVVGLLVTAGLVPFVRSQMFRHGVLDVPNHRSSHTLPVPRGGGWACVAGIVAASCVAWLRHREVSWLAVLAALVLALLGFLDDRHDLSVAARLTGQVATGALVGAATGGPAVALAAAVLFPAVLNVVNFMDGINGITSLTMTVWGLTALAAGVHENKSAIWVMGAATAGAALGFLPWNAPVARIFLGDVGSYLFGAVAAGGILLGWAAGLSPAVMCAPLSVYLADTASTIVARGRRGEPLLEAHRSHTYQRLCSGPSPLPHLAVALYASGLAALITLAWAFAPSGTALLVTAAGLSLYLGSPALLSTRAALGRGAR